MAIDQSLLRRIPKVDELLNHALLAELPASPPKTEAVRTVLDALRDDILAGRLDQLPPDGQLAGAVLDHVHAAARPSLRRVINATGVILHTNLGRAPLAEVALQTVSDVARGYSTLEYSVEHGSRGSRHSHVESLICELTGAEAAMVVNNNAAAVLLMLSAIAHGKDVVVSRGELVEIGGAFRIPDVMSQSGCRLAEVGTTNKTRAADYERAIDADFTGALMKVHTSNFKILGFTEEVSRANLVELGHKYGIPVLEDLGSGCLLPLGPYGIAGEPTVGDSVAAGVDVVSFSGDKLLGGPQAGIVVGKAEYILAMKRHPLARALRIDKLTLAALEGTLRLYRDPARALDEIPLLRMLSADIDTLDTRADTLLGLIKNDGGLRAERVREHSEAGGGSAPGQVVDTTAVAVASSHISVEVLEAHLRGCEVPIIARIAHDRLLLDMRTVDDGDIPYIAACLNGAPTASGAVVTA